MRQGRDVTRDGDGLGALSARLDALGAHEAARAPDGLEERVLAKVGGVFAEGAIPIRAARPAWWAGGPARAAAAAALLAVGASALYTQSGRRAPARAAWSSVALAEQRIEGLLALTDDADRFDDRIASIELLADAISADGADAWGVDLTEPDLVFLDGGAL